VSADPDRGAAAGADAGGGTDGGEDADGAGGADASAGAEAERRLDATIRGHVHGVGFRVFVLRRARELGLRGWVANESGGTVRCVAEGPERELRTLLEALREGPPAAWVERVQESWLPATAGLTAFEIRSGWHAGD
jgi:acylphosphatase